MSYMRILWCITGGGHMLDETCKAIEELAGGNEIAAVFSKAGREVVEMYGYSKRIKKSVKKIFYEEEQGHSSPMVCKLGLFDLVVVSPCTANTAAKMALGIADSLVSNIAAQTLKLGRKVFVLPTDTEKEIETITQKGGKIRLKCREVDVENVRRLKSMENLVVIQHPSEVKKFVENVD